MRAALLLCLVGCGRVGFDPVAIAGNDGSIASDVTGSLDSCAGGADVTSGLVAWWKFDELSGPTAADAIAGHDGTLMGGASWAAGHHGGAIAFDGIDGSVQIGTAVVYATQAAPFSFSAWFELADYVNFTPDIMQIQSDTTSPFNVILSNQVGYFGISLGSGDGIWVPIETMNLPTTGTWHHVAVVFDGVDPGQVADYQIVLDDVPQNLLAASAYGSIAESSQIGAGRDLDNQWKGLIEDVRIYNRALSIAEVGKIFTACH